MAFTYGFYNYDENDDQADQKVYDAQTVSKLFDGLITEGVYAHVGYSFAVKETIYANKVVVRSGRAWFRHTWSFNDADLTIELPGPHSVYSRIDAIVLDVNNDTRHNEIKFIQGTATDNPIRPTLINTDTRVQVPLAYITRPAGQAMISSSDITRAVGMTEAPYVTGILEGLDYSDFQASFDSFMANSQSAFNSFMNESEIDFDVWFNAAKLQFENWFAQISEEFVGSAELVRLGTPSATAVSTQYLRINKSVTYPISGSSYMRDSKTLSTSQDTTYVFTNAANILNSTHVDVYTDLGLDYKSCTIDAAAHTVTVVYEPVSTAQTMQVDIFLIN